MDSKHGIKPIHVSWAHLEGSDESRVIENPDACLEKNGRSSTDQSDDHPLVVRGSGRGQLSEPCVELIDIEEIKNGNFIQLVSTSGVQSTHLPENPNSRSSSSPASSLPSTPSEDLIELKAIDRVESGIADEHNPRIVHVSSKSAESEGSSDHTPNSPISGVTHESFKLNVMPPTQSPAIQVMDRGGYDPNRIAPSVFESTRSTTAGPPDWSEASNESLFSIRIDNSFRRDYAVNHHELKKSGELLKSSELITINPSLPVQVVDSEGKKFDLEKKSREKVATTVENANGEKLSQPEILWNLPTSPKNSDKSTNSRNLSSLRKKNEKKKKKKKKKCGCSRLCSCKRLRSCSCKWPKLHCCSWQWSCCFSWPWSHRCASWMTCCSSCSCAPCYERLLCRNSCWWPSCESSCCCGQTIGYNYNCGSKKSSSLVEKATIDQVKTEAGEQKLQPAQESKPKSSFARKWFRCSPSCRSCCPSRSCSCS